VFEHFFPFLYLSPGFFAYSFSLQENQEGTAKRNNGNDMGVPACEELGKDDILGRLYFFPASDWYLVQEFR
jgi:hypothetical protein